MGHRIIAKSHHVAPANTQRHVNNIAGRSCASDCDSGSGVDGIWTIHWVACCVHAPRVDCARGSCEHTCRRVWQLLAVTQAFVPSPQTASCHARQLQATPPWLLLEHALSWRGW